MIGAALLLAAQTGVWSYTPAVPTVGDTVRVTTTVEIGVGERVRIPVPRLAGSEVELLHDPVVAELGATALVILELAFFATGDHPLELPRIEILGAEGESRFVPADTVVVSVASVLPVGDTAPSPRPPRAPVVRDVRSPWRAALFPAGVAVLAGLWLAWRRRPPRPEEAVAPPDRRRPMAPLDAWSETGESRTVAAAAAMRLREAVARREPELKAGLDAEEFLASVREFSESLPVREIEELTASLQRAQFSPMAPGDVVVLVDQVDDLVAHLAEDEEA